MDKELGESEPKKHPATVDEAIAACDTHIRRQSVLAGVMVLLLVIFMVTLYLVVKSQEITGDSIVSLFNMGTQSPEQMQQFANAKMKLYFTAMLLFLAVFGITVALYRFHLVEIVRNEQMKLGFWRIRIAARNANDPGFLTEVRQSLTKDAFVFERKAEKSKRIESPVPGHPGADLATEVCNRVLENFEIVLQERKKQ